MSNGAADWRLTVYPSLDSTSDLCVSLAGDGEPDGLAVLALTQTRGRGSRGRNWTAPSGNLNLSVLLRPPGPTASVGHWALLAGVALAEAFLTLLPDPSRLALKWPNDVLLDGHKLAGILVDAGGADGRLDWLVIGLGANLASAPEIAGRGTASLAAAGIPPPEPEAFAASVLQRLGHWRRRCLEEGFACVRVAWLHYAQPIGSALRVARQGRSASGAFAGLAEDGSLLLLVQGRVESVSTGDVLLDAPFARATQ